MPIGRHLWRLRGRVVGYDRVVTHADVSQVTRESVLSKRGRARLRALLARELVLGPASHARIRVGDAIVELGSTEDFAIDWKAFVEVFGEEPYDADYADAAVLDVGAHKGYFGAYALARGAAFVASYEPGEGNFAALRRASEPLACRWLARNVAVGGTAGEGVLHLDETSWAHSLLETERPAGEQRVSIVTLGDALADLPAAAARTIVKIDAEGSEWDILERGELLALDLLLVECHPAAARRSKGELVELVERHGLEVLDASAGVLRFARRASGGPAG